MKEIDKIVDDIFDTGKVIRESLTQITITNEDIVEYYISEEKNVKTNINISSIKNEFKNLLIESLHHIKKDIYTIENKKGKIFEFINTLIKKGFLTRSDITSKSGVGSVWKQAQWLTESTLDGEDEFPDDEIEKEYQPNDWNKKDTGGDSATIFNKFNEYFKGLLSKSEIVKYGEWKLIEEIENSGKIISERVIGKGDIYEIALNDLGFNEIILLYSDINLKINNSIKNIIEKSKNPERFSDKKKLVANILFSRRHPNTETKERLSDVMDVIDDIYNYVVDNKIIQKMLYRSYEQLNNIITTYMKSGRERVTEEEKQETLIMIREDLKQFLELIKESPQNFKKHINSILKNASDIDRISDVFKEVRGELYNIYEKSFCELCNGEYFTCEEEDENGEMKSTLGDKSRLTEISIKDVIKKYYPQPSDIDEVKIENIVGVIYENISKDKINKYDIITKKEIKLNGGITIEHPSKIEVKKTKKHDYHLSEFLTIYKNADDIRKYLHEENYIEIYNEVVVRVVERLDKNDKGIREKIRSDISGIFLEDYLYCDINNLELYWSVEGQRKKIKRIVNGDVVGIYPEYRITLRFKVDESKLVKWNPKCDENTYQIDEYVDKFLNF
jgi:hypothetical protein